MSMNTVMYMYAYIYILIDTIDLLLNEVAVFFLSLNFLNLLNFFLSSKHLINHCLTTQYAPCSLLPRMSLSSHISLLDSPRRGFLRSIDAFHRHSRMNNIAFIAAS